MTTKNALLLMTGTLTFFAGLPISFAIQYMLYQHVQAPQAVWVLWLIQVPVLVLCSVLNVIANRIEEKK